MTIQLTQLQKNKQGYSKIRAFIRRNPTATSREIRNFTKCKVEHLYPSLEDAYIDAGVIPPSIRRNRSKEQQMYEVINYIQNNPSCTTEKIFREVHANPYRLFGSIRNAFRAAGVEYPTRINNGGITDQEVFRNALKYEQSILDRMSKYGKIDRKVKVRSGYADAVLTSNGKSMVIEVKYFRGRRNVNMTHIRQLVRYMLDLNINYGLLICPEESLPRRKKGRNVFIGSLAIMIRSDKEIVGP